MAVVNHCLFSTEYFRIQARIRTPSIKCTTLLVTLTRDLLNIKKKNRLNKMFLLSNATSSSSLHDGDLGIVVVTAKLIASQSILPQFFCHACACVFSKVTEMQMCLSYLRTQPIFPPALCLGSLCFYRKLSRPKFDIDVSPFISRW